MAPNLRKAGRGARRAPWVPYFRAMSRVARPASRLGLTASEAARHLGVSISTVRRWSDAGHLRGYRTPGGQRRFSVAQLEEFLDSLAPRDSVG
jgi:excisionase family DNA binding protein